MIRIISNIILALIVMSGIAAAYLFFTYIDWNDTNPGKVDAAADPCPEGSYFVEFKSKEAGAICRLQPTGCPYGDSISMQDCEKFAPQEEIKTKPATQHNKEKGLNGK